MEKKFGPKPLLDLKELEKLYYDGHRDYPFYREKFNVSHKTVYRAFKKIGLTLEERKVVAELKNNKQAIIHHYQKYNSISKTSKTFGFNIKTLRNYLKKWSVFVSEQPKHNANYDFFEKIDTEEKAYWLGFIYADGTLNNVHSLKIALAQQDIEHLNKFNKSLNSTYPVRVYQPSKNSVLNEQPMAEVTLTSQKLINDLNNKNVFKRKTHFTTFPSDEIVPKKLKKHFIRGIFDRDSSIFHCYSTKKKTNGFYMNKNGEKKLNFTFNITGNYDLIKGIQDFMVSSIDLSNTKLTNAAHHPKT